MALELTNFTGFDTGDLVENVGTAGSPLVQSTTVDDKTYALECQTSDNYWFACRETDSSTFSADQGHVFGVRFRMSSTAAPSGGDADLFEIEDSGGGVILRVVFEDSTGNISLEGAGLSELDNAATPFTANTWHTVIVWFEEKNSGNAKVWVDGTLELQATAQDFSTGSRPHHVVLKSSSNGHTHYYSKPYWYADAAETDRIESWTIEGPYSHDAFNTGTDQGTALDSGNWQDISEIPWGTTDQCIYSGSGAQSGSVICDNTPSTNSMRGPSSQSGGAPSGTYIAAKYCSLYERGSGSGTTHYLEVGNSGDGVTQRTVAALGSVEDYRGTISSAATIMPTSSEDFQFGFAKGSGGREAEMDCMFAILLVQGATDTTVEQTNPATMTMSGNQADVNAEVIVDQTSVATMTMSGNQATIDVSADVIVNQTAAATMTFTGQQADVNAEVIVDQVAPATMTFTGQTADVNAETFIEQVAPATMTMTGQQADVNAEVIVDQVTPATMTMTGQQADVNAEVIVDQTAAATMTMVGQVADISLGINVNQTNPATMTMVGQTADVNAEVFIEQNAPATMTMVGQLADVNAEVIVDQVAAAAMTMVGQAADVKLNVVVNQTNPATMTMSGNTADVNAETIVDQTAAATMTMVGQTADVNAEVIVDQTNPATMTMTGQTADVNAETIVDQVAAATMTMSGNQATIIIGSDVVVNQTAPATMTMSGQLADVNAEVIVDQVAPATMTMTTNAATIETTNDIIVNQTAPATMTMVGQVADVNASRIIDAVTASMLMSTEVVILTGAPYGQAGGGTSGPRRVISLGVIS